MSYDDSNPASMYFIPFLSVVIPEERFVFILILIQSPNPQLSPPSPPTAHFTSLYNSNNCQTLHGTAIYANIGVVSGVNVGIYGIHGVPGIDGNLSTVHSPSIFCIHRPSIAIPSNPSVPHEGAPPLRKELRCHVGHTAIHLSL